MATKKLISPNYQLDINGFDIIGLTEELILKTGFKLAVDYQDIEDNFITAAYCDTLEEAKELMHSFCD